MNAKYLIDQTYKGYHIKAYYNSNKDIKVEFKHDTGDFSKVIDKDVATIGYCFDFADECIAKLHQIKVIFPNERRLSVRIKKYIKDQKLNVSEVVISEPEGDFIVVILKLKNDNK